MTAHKDPTSRMKKRNSKASVSDEKPNSEVKESIELVDKIEENEVEEKDLEKGDENTGNIDPEINKESIADEELIPPDDLDLQQFYFTGKLEHSFKLRGFDVTLRLLDAKEVEETNRILWELMGEKVSMDMITLTHSIEVIGRALIKYGKQDISNKSEEERLEFARSIPGILIPVIARKYSILEESMHKALTSGEVKN